MGSKQGFKVIQASLDINKFSLWQPLNLFKVIQASLDIHNLKIINIYPTSFPKLPKLFKSNNFLHFDLQQPLIVSGSI